MIHRPRSTRPAMLATIRLGLGLVSCGLAGSCVAHQPPLHRSTDAPRSDAKALPFADEEVVQALLDAHNFERTRKRLSVLSPSPELSAIAATHAADMARRGKMSHRGGDGSSPFDRIERENYSFRAAGENVAAGFESVDAVMAGWMRSPGHRRNILGAYTEVGLARAIAPSGLPYWCAVFGTPAAP